MNIEKYKLKIIDVTKKTINCKRKKKVKGYERLILIVGIGFK